MNSSEIIKTVDSILSTKAVGSIADVSADLSLPEGENIQELLNKNEKETEEEQKN
jgi:hypothetical protein